jgi:GNAT superfamily N-acetyltransferase
MGLVEIIEADLTQPSQQQAVVTLTAAYAADRMGGGQPLSDEVRRALIPGLRRHPGTLIFLAYHEGEPVGIATCFRGFSTFAARPLINIHDLAVLPAYRGRGIGRRLLQAVESKAREEGCCRLTLEVWEENLTARRTYEAAGFGQASYANASGSTLFLSKVLS